VVAKSAGRIIPVGCWAHARRNFLDARLNQPREVSYVLGLIAQLYDIEDTIRLKSGAERLAARQGRIIPVLDWLFVGSDQGGEMAATCFSILAGAKRHRIE
jgi:hypothetical protein